MSTKIYEAFRFPITKMREFVEIAHKEIFDSQVKNLKKIWVKNVHDAELESSYKLAYGSFFKTLLLTTLSKEDRVKFKNEYKNRVAADKVADRMMLDKLTSLQHKYDSDVTRRSWFDINCGIVIYLDNEYGYAYFYGVPGFMPRWDEVKFPRDVVEYAYYNNTDHPEHLSYEEWEKRGEVWHSMLDNSGAKVYHPVIDIENFSADVRIIVGLQEALKDPHPTYDRGVEFINDETKKLSEAFDKTEFIGMSKAYKFTEWLDKHHEKIDLDNVEQRSVEEVEKFLFSELDKYKATLKKE